MTVKKKKKNQDILFPEVLLLILKSRLQKRLPSPLATAPDVN